MVSTSLSTPNFFARLPYFSHRRSTIARNNDLLLLSTRVSPTRRRRSSVPYSRRSLSALRDARYGFINGP